MLSASSAAHIGQKEQSKNVEGNLYFKHAA
jgi:hypothetical protein